jgi:hypothetical protein
LKAKRSLLPISRPVCYPLRGQSASIINYLNELEHVETRLKNFYAGDDNLFQKRRKRGVEKEQVESHYPKIIQTRR